MLFCEKFSMYLKICQKSIICHNVCKCHNQFERMTLEEQESKSNIFFFFNELFKKGFCEITQLKFIVKC